MSLTTAASLHPGAGGPAYDKAAALDFFRTAGTPETVPQGAALFVEHQHSGRLGVNVDKMYLLVNGVIDILAARKPIGAIKAGEIFGEIALIDQSPRVASAVAETDCALLGMNRITLLRVLRNKPEFGAALLRGLADRMRFLISRHR